MEYQFLLTSQIEKQVSFQIRSIYLLLESEEEETIIVATVQSDEKISNKTVHIIPNDAYNQWNYSDIEYRNLDCDVEVPSSKSSARILFEVLTPNFNETYTNAFTSTKIPFYSVKACGILPLFSTSDALPSLLQGRQKVDLFPIALLERNNFKYTQHEYSNIQGKLESSINWEDKLICDHLKETMKPKLTIPPIDSYPSVIISDNNLNPGQLVVAKNNGHIIVDLPNFPCVVYLHTTYSFNFSHFQSDFKKEKVSQIQDLSVNNTDNRIIITNEAKPTSKERREIEKALSTFRLSQEQKELLFQYRKYLSSIHVGSGRALVKFLQSVDWNNHLYSTKAIQLVKNWKDIAPFAGVEMLYVYDQLPYELRLISAELIRSIERDELLKYLLPIVKILPKTHDQLTPITSINITAIIIDSKTKEQYGSLILEILIAHAQTNFIFANYFYWFVRAKSETNSIYDQYKNLILKLLNPEFKSAIEEQERFRNTLSRIYREKLLDNQGAVDELLLKYTFPQNGLRLPINPEVRVISIQKISFFSSNTRPIRIVFDTSDASTYSIMYKYDDDLSLDNYFLQMLRLIDTYLKKEHFDLRLTPYEVIPTSNYDGFIEFVDSSTSFIKIRSEHSSLHSYFQTLPSNQAMIMENFIFSCAGYATVNYIFGLGDRHENNLMLRQNGRFFHIDFGYIFGKEPPIVKYFYTKKHYEVAFSNMMWNFLVDHEKRFTDICCEAYRRIRSIAPTICYLTALMECENEASFNGATSFVERRLRLDVDDSEADDHFRKIIVQCRPDVMSTLGGYIYYQNQKGWAFWR